MGYRHGDSIYDSKHAAQMAEVGRWLDPHNATSASEIREQYEDDPDSLIDEMMRDHEDQGWHVPGSDEMTRDQAQDLIEEWIAEATQ